MNTRYDLPDNLYFAGGGDTFVTLPGIVILVIACILILVCPRKYAILPLLIAGLLISVGQKIVVVNLHFMAYRLLILMAWIRILWNSLKTRRAPFPRPMNALDWCVTLWAISNSIVFTILWHESAALVNRLGFLYTTFGAYFSLRYFIRDRLDVIRAIKALAAISAVIAAVMLTEHFTGKNPLSTFGGIPENSLIRDGRIRAEGPFLHPIVAGVFGAMLLPLFVGLWWQGGGNRWSAAVGLLSSTIITITAASSTPVMTYAAGAIALCFWRFRKNMKVFRWALVLALLAAQLVMKAPVWFLLSRVSNEMGGSGWHRAMLIDQFLRRFGEWWLIGTQNNVNWGYDMWDCINAYVKAGVEGGLVTFALFIAVLVYAFKRIGTMRAFAESTRRDALLIWAIGACLFANSVAFFGETYYDQSVIAWYALLVMIATMPFQTEAKVRFVSQPAQVSWGTSVQPASFSKFI